MDLPFYREYELPWTTGKEQEKKFQRLLGIIFLVCLALSIVWPFIPVPDPDPFDVEEIPPRIAQLMLEDKPLPPPPPPPKEEEPEPEVDEPEPEQVVEKEPEPEPETQPEPEPEPLVIRAEQAREVAQAAIMPFSEELADLVLTHGVLPAPRFMHRIIKYHMDMKSNALKFQRSMAAAADGEDRLLVYAQHQLLSAL